MAESAVKPRIHRFGLFELDLQARELRKSGIRVKLHDQPFEILAMLLEHPGEIVSREQLQKRLWSADTFVDFDLSLNSAVKKLRQALNDDSDNPRFIETLYRRGYRFIGPVSNGTHPELSASVPAVSTLPVPPRPAPPIVDQSPEPENVHPARHWKSRALLAVALPAFLALGAAFWLYPVRPIRVLGYTQITHDGVHKISIVTDRDRLYVSEVDGDHWVIAQVSANGGETATLPTPFSNIFIGDIAPDGSALLASNFKGTAHSSGLWSLPLPAGTPRRVGDITPLSATSSPDGRLLAFSQRGTIYLANPDASNSRKLATVNGQAFNLRFSPDGRRLRFSLHDTQAGSDELWEVKADGSGLHALLKGWNPAPLECCGNWTRDGKYYVFESFRQGSSNIWVLPETSRWPGVRPAPVQLTNGPLGFSAPVPSLDGKKIYAIGQQSRSEVLRFEPKMGLAPYFGNTSAIDLAFSPDGQWVAYVSVPNYTLWRSRVDGSQQLQLTSTSMYTALPRWSPDGTQIVFMARDYVTNYRTFLVSANGGNPRELVPGADAGFDPSWSPDGKSIALTLTDPDVQGSTGISVLDLATHKLAELPDSAHYFSPRWSPDGRYIAAITKDSQKLMLFEIATRQWSELSAGEGGLIGYPSWSHDGQYLYFDTTLTEDPGFFRMHISDRKVEKLLSLKEVRRFQGGFGSWTGLAPDDSLLVARDISSQEVYALDWQAP
jgi:Tol biopolymer transport system component/DNA-binding winged helix-turn-helix (wHTH) protein